MSGNKRRQDQARPPRRDKPVPIRPPGWQKLNQLGAEQQETLCRWLKELSLDQTRRRLQREFGLTVSASALEYFQQRHYHSFQLTQAVSATRLMERELKQAYSSSLSGDAASLAAQLHFEQMALANDDLTGFTRLRRLRQTDQALELRKNELAVRRQKETERALDVLGQELQGRPDCLALFQAIRERILPGTGT